jgi:Trypsin
MGSGGRGDDRRLGPDRRLSPPPTSLRTGVLTLQAATRCKLGFLNFESAWELCGLDPGDRYTTCNGDSGGPLLAGAPGSGAEPLEIGITSFGDEGCPTGAPAYFTRADTVAGWVRQKVAEWPPAPAPAAEPTPQVATLRLPVLGGARAELLLRRALRKQLRGRFRGHRAFRARCAPVTRSSRRCRVAWWVGDRDYRGTVTVFYAFAGGKLVWNDRYAIRQTSRRCRLRSLHPGACPTTTFRR